MKKWIGSAGACFVLILGATPFLMAHLGGRLVYEFDVGKQIKGHLIK